jgi:aspartyl-tRNA(Asn)/glutamyl-tRNA(Gln) amidotransferase subunit B
LALEFNMNKYHLVLGLEIHFHLRTKKKVFCGCIANFYGAKPNTHVCPTCLGLPGALPVANFEAVEKAQLLGMALNCNLNEFSRFDRKHYFYPDLPKGYQISQYLYPLCLDGFVELDSGKKCELERIHLEEDTAKSIHRSGETLIDFNKSGSPLVEIVTKPIFESASEAVEFAKKIQDVVRKLDIADVDMEKGQLRLEANISVRTTEMKEKGILPDYKVEVKNINSFRFLEKAINYEIERQSQILEKGEEVPQENRGFNEVKNITVSQRKKEEAKDYRYFPDPDLPPMHFDKKHFEKLKDLLPELPHQIYEKLKSKYSLNENQARFLSNGDGLLLIEKFYNLAEKSDPTKVANILINKPESRELSNEEFINLIKASEVSEISNERLEEAVSIVLRNETDAFEKLKSGKDQVLMYLVGQVMRELKTKADTSKIISIIKSKL